MPLDKVEASATPTTRRTFLARAATGGVLVGAGVATGTLGLFGAPAGAQDAEPSLVDAGALTPEAFGAAATPLELAAVQAYQAALDGGRLDDAWQEHARRFQEQHRTAATALAGLVGEDAEEPVADPQLLSSTVAEVEGAADQTAVLAALSPLELGIAATHLAALSGLAEPTLAKLVAQVLAVENQQGALLGRAGGTDLTELTPAAVSTEGARPLDAAAETAPTSTTTTTEAAN